MNKPFPKIVKHTNIPKLTSNLGNTISVNGDVFNNCQELIQAVLYNGTSKETYAGLKVRLGNKVYTRNSIQLPPDPALQKIP